MKTLLLIRHAKSSWKDPALTDLQRPLKKRGEKNAMEMAERLLSRQIPHQRLLCSPANRAIQTAEFMQKAGLFSLESVELCPDLYTFDYGDVMRFVRTLDDQLDHIALVGHNPAITDLVNFMALESIKNIPTCGVAVLNVSVSRWGDIKAGCATLRHYDFPKNETGDDL